MSTRTSHPQTRRGTMMNRLSSVRTTAALLVPVLAATLMTTMPSSAVAAPTTATPADVKGIKVKPVTATQRPEWTASKRELTESDLPADPVVAAGAQTVDLAGAAASTSAARSPSLKGVKAGKLPVYVAAASAPAAAADRAPDARVAGGPVRKVRVEVLDRRSADAAAVNGVVMKLARADGVQQAGQARVTVDYRSFQGLFGGDALSRLRLIRLSDGQPVPSVNDPKAGTLSATLSLAAAGAASSFAVAAAPSGGNGDYKGTSLTPASTWQVSQQNGSFAWSYPIKVPSPPGGMVPEVALSYSSGAIDGRTSGNNTQGSWIGDGWDLWPGFVERSYRGCTDDRDEKEKPNPNNKDVPGGDLCYFNDNATLSLNGSATELVKVAGTDTGNKDDNVQYRGVSDDGARIEMIRDGRDNGDADGTHWRVTTINGTQYYFGRDKGEGGASAGTRTDSVFTAPVFSNHPDEGGYNKDFGKSRVTRAWRWNLDYAVDPNGNTMTYFYNKEVGAYAREGDENKRTDYDRAGSLARIEYGSRRDAPASVRPAARVMFQAADRCLGKCVDANDKPIAKRFPDAPWELHCDKAPCKTQFSPTFWTRKRLSTITTQVYAGTGDTYTDVDSWQLAQTYLQAGGNESTPMWLKSITHNGLVTTAGGLATNDPARAGLVVTDPTVVFNPNADLMPNRVNTPNGHSSLFRSRLETITTESGAQMGISYSKPHCDNAAVPKAWNNTKRCFPQFYGAEGEDPKLDWFHKYVVTRVDVYDNTGGFEHQQTNYDYLDSPAWAYDDSELVEPKKRTWGQFRGYGRVQVRHGVESGVQSRTEYRYFRGMDGDKQPKTDELPPKGTPRPVDVEDSFGGRIDDHPAFAGMLREQITYNGRGDGDWVSGTLNTPEHHGPTASTGTLRAWKVHTANTRERMKLSNGQTRWTKSVTKVNDDNLTTEVNDLGDEANPDDDRCARTEYARNTTTWMLDRVKRTESLSVNCDAPIERPRDVLSETRTYYDNADTHGLPPVRGLPVRAEVLDHWDGQTARYVTVGRTGYDSVGRVTSKSDALSRTTTTSYTPQITGPVTRSTVTNPLGHTTTTDFHPALGVPVKATDANGGITQITYDGAGRLLAIWAPGRAKATYPNDPTVSYAYQLRKTASSTVTTKTLMPTGSTMYRTAVTLHDGLLRPRQTQTQTISGGRAITDTVYDSRGQASWSSNAYYDIDNTAPGTTLVTAHARPEIPALTENVYDGAGRLTDARFVVNGDVKWRTTATYAGEKTSVTPPPGGVATTTVVDARGRKAEIRHYKDPAQAGSDDQVAFDRTTYAYTDRDELASVEGPGSNTWTYKYDLRGNKKSSNDPDAGSSTFEYDKAGQLTSAKDARGKVVAVSYDDLGRKTTTRQGSPDGPKLAEWEYDTLTYGVGKLTKSTRFEYDKTGAQLAYTNAITGYDPVGRPNGSAVTIPASNDGLCVSRTLQPCTFPQTYTYWLNGAIEKIKFPAVAGLPAEDLKHLYNEIGLPGGLLGNRVYAQSVVYNQLDKLIGKNLGEHGTRVGLGYGYDEPTGRLHSFRAIAENKTDVYNIKYQHNDAGAITEITDTPDAGQPAETQCFSYDHLSRLTQAWTPKSLTCAVGPDAAALNQLAPYWRSYTFDAAGNRKTEVIHGVSDNTRTYRYPASGGGPGSKPHAVTQVDTTSGTTQQYAYDPTGNTICRPTGTTANTCAPDGTAGADSQTLNWNDE
ncbi:MAG TPA: SpvB/TcaC N-terminal domain-containing protein, partial [Catenuloplanes sp.]